MAYGLCRRCARHRRVGAGGLCWSCRAPERRRARERTQKAARRPPTALEAPVGLAALLRDARAHLIALHGERCFACGRPGPVELDHRRPLWTLSADERADPRWWLPSNTQLLCPPCHRAKTGLEATERAAARRRSRAA